MVNAASRSVTDDGLPRTAAEVKPPPCTAKNAEYERNFGLSNVIGTSFKTSLYHVKLSFIPRTTELRRAPMNKMCNSVDIIELAQLKPVDPCERTLVQTCTMCTVLVCFVNYFLNGDC